MADNNAMAAGDVQENIGGSPVSGWPAVVTAIIMISAAIYSFSPRPFAAYEETKVRADQIIVNGVDGQGSQYLAVGELGQILYANSPEGPWTSATITPDRGATLTDVTFIGGNVAIAVGHNGWIIRSEDGGKTWNELAFNKDSSSPLLSINGPFAGPAAGKMFALGAFGQFLTSTDLGNTWESSSLEVVEDDAASDDFADEASDDADSDDYDPFAAFSSGGGASDVSGNHMYAVDQAGDGSLYLVGERGLVVRSTDGGETWQQPEQFYNGSLYGVVPLHRNGVLVYGMRGNAFVTRDDGATWTKSKIPLVQGLYEGKLTADGRIVLLGASNTILESKDGGASFEWVSKRGPNGLVAMKHLDGNRWLTGGEGGVAITTIGKGDE